MNDADKEKATAYLKTIDTSLFDTHKIHNAQFRGHMQLSMSTETIALHFVAGVHNGKIRVEGETMYKANDSWWTFDRRGIDISFYSPFAKCAVADNWDTDSVILEQIERAEKAIAKAVADGPRFEVFPHIHLSQAAIDKRVADFKKDGHVLFTPAGMGTAYRVQQRYESFARPLSARQRELLKIENAWVTTQDWD